MFDSRYLENLSQLGRTSEEEFLNKGIEHGREGPVIWQLLEDIILYEANFLRAKFWRTFQKIYNFALQINFALSSVNHAFNLNK